MPDIMAGDTAVGAAGTQRRERLTARTPAGAQARDTCGTTVLVRASCWLRARTGEPADVAEPLAAADAARLLAD